MKAGLYTLGLSRMDVSSQALAEVILKISVPDPEIFISDPDRPRIRNHELQIRIREANNYESRADPDPTWTFLWPLEKYFVRYQVVNH